MNPCTCDGTGEDGGAPPGFERVPHTADLAVRIRAATPEDLFVRAARAMFAVMLEPAGGREQPAAGETADGGEERIVVEAADPAGLLQAWLSELLYRFSADRRVGTGFAIRALRGPWHGDPGPCALEASVRSERYDPARQAVRSELKAVTFHQLRVERSGGGWEAHVIFDV
jgi:SHS2 domain-containing protein